jgi:serine/threonine protein kinase
VPSSLAEVAVAEEMFGRYRLEALIGQGGMGEVWRAFDEERHRTVALKRLPRAMSADADFQARFRRESEVTARLREPHIIPIHDFGEIDGQLFIDMRLVDGTDLNELIKAAGPLDPERVVRIIAQAANALDAAHADGLVHRDVKPSNILVSGESDFVYLVDFGVARAVSDAAALTATGDTVGTMDYMSPERFHGRAGDARSDVYSLTCVLFQALTGRKPYPVAGHPALIHAHLNLDAPVPSEVRPALWPFDEVIAAGMAKDPDRRYERAGELAAAAEAAVRETAAAPPVTGTLSLAELTEQIDDLSRAIEVDPSASLLCRRARLHGWLGHHDDALADYTRAIELDPADPEPLEGRAETYRQLGRFDEAVADLEAGSALVPELSWWQFRRAMILADQGRPAESRRALDDAVRRGIAEVTEDPDSPTAAITLSIMRAARELDGASQLIGQALSRVPSPGDVVKELGKLGRIVSDGPAGLDKLLGKLRRGQ